MITTKCPSCAIPMTLNRDIYDQCGHYNGAIVLCRSCRTCSKLQPGGNLRELTSKDTEKWSDKQRKAYRDAVNLL